MAIQFSAAVRNACLDATEAAIGMAPQLMIYSGSAPANCAATENGTLLATLTLPSNWMTDASGGAKALAGTWSGTGSTAGTAAHYRIYDSTGTICHVQGSVTITNSGGDMTMDNTNIASGQAITVSSFSLTAGNA